MIMKNRIIALGAVMLSFITPGHATTYSDSSGSSDGDYYYSSIIDAYNSDDILPGSGLSVDSIYPSGDYIGDPVRIESYSAYTSPQSSYVYTDNFGYNSDPNYYSSSYSATAYGFDVYVTPLSDFYFEDVPITVSFTSIINLNGNSFQGVETELDPNDYSSFITTTSGNDSHASAFTLLEVSQEGVDAEGSYEYIAYQHSVTDYDYGDGASAPDVYYSASGSPSMMVDIFEPILIDMSVSTSAYGHTSSGWTSAEAKIYDVTVNIDPTWEYASSFEINYEYVDWSSVSPVPEPSTLFMFGAGLAFLGFRRKKVTAA